MPLPAEPPGPAAPKEPLITDPQEPLIFFLPQARERARETLAAVNNTLRSRVTLVIILAIAGVVVLAMFLYLIVRKK